MQALKARGIGVEFFNKKEDAFRRLTELIPPGAEVMTGSSTTLSEIGFAATVRFGNVSNIKEFVKWLDIKKFVNHEHDGRRPGSETCMF